MRVSVLYGISLGAIFTGLFLFAAPYLTGIFSMRKHLLSRRDIF